MIEWETPDLLFEQWDKEYRFTLDVCATSENAKCSRFFSPEDDGLSQSWRGFSCWCNPPYGRDVGAWVQKAELEARDHRTTVVMLLPAKTDTAWFHDYVWKPGPVITFYRGRVHFKNGGRPRFASMVVVWQ